MPRKGSFSKIGLTLLAVLLATFLWIYVENETTGRKQVDVTLVYTNIPEDLVIKRGNPDTVTALVHGPEMLLPRLMDGNLELEVDLEGETYGEIAVLVNVMDIKAPNWADVERVEPDELIISLDRVKIKQVPILPKLTGTVAEGYTFDGRYMVNPATVTISGPEETIDGIREIWTSPLLIEGKTETFQEIVNVFSKWRGVSIINPQEHVVQVVIVPDVIERFFEDIPIVTQNGSHTLELDREWIDVWLEGPRLVLRDLQKGQIQAVLDLDGLEPRERAHLVDPFVKFSPPLEGSAGLDASFSPAQVGVRILGVGTDSAGQVESSWIMSPPKTNTAGFQRENLL